MLLVGLRFSLNTTIHLCGFSHGLYEVYGLFNLEVLGHDELVEAERSVYAVLWHVKSHPGLNVVGQSLLVDSKVVHGQRIEGELVEILDFIVIQLHLLD